MNLSAVCATKADTTTETMRYIHQRFKIASVKLETITRVGDYYLSKK